MKINRFWGRLLVIILLAGAICCEYKVGIPLLNAFLDVVLTVAVFLVGYNDTQKKNASQQDQLHNLQNRIAQLEADKTNPQPSVDWKHTIKR